jgi:CheY-like chemotaxis protein
MASNMHKILVAEDSEDDFLLIRDAFAENDLPVELLRVNDGEELLDYLFRRGPFASAGSAPAPELILLDLKMPRKNGLEALKEIKADPVLKRIPVIAFSTSGAEQDIRQAYDLGINAYVKKPVGFVLFSEAAKAIFEFWLRLARRSTSS